MRWAIGLLCVAGLAHAASGFAAEVAAGRRPPEGAYEYAVVATSRTSTMEREMNEWAEDGYRFQGVMGGDTAFGGSEFVAVMMRGAGASGRFAYRVLATAQTSTMQDEMTDAGGEGYDYRGQTVYSSLFGGDEVVVIMEQDNDAPQLTFEYLLLATSQTSTLHTELNRAGPRGFELVGVSVGETTFGGEEVVVITRRVTAR
ncbi:MAG: hypothetical protein OSB03_10040 [Vicinamibacterales bacterium]|nr:hypothetical protein [Vicinamibacterales bacterium]